MFLLTILYFLQCGFCPLSVKLEALCLVTCRKISSRNLPADLILSVTLDDILGHHIPVYALCMSTEFIDYDKESLQDIFHCRGQEIHLFPSRFVGTDFL